MFWTRLGFLTGLLSLVYVPVLFFFEAWTGTAASNFDFSAKVGFDSILAWTTCMVAVMSFIWFCVSSSFAFLPFCWSTGASSIWIKSLNWSYWMRFHGWDSQFLHTDCMEPYFAKIGRSAASILAQEQCSQSYYLSQQIARLPFLSSFSWNFWNLLLVVEVRLVPLIMNSCTHPHRQLRHSYILLNQPLRKEGENSSRLVRSVSCGV